MSESRGQFRVLAQAMVRRFGRRPVPDGLEEPPVAEPVDPFECRALDRLRPRQGLLGAGPSWACPGESGNVRALRASATTICIWVVQPPRDRPMAWGPFSSAPPPIGRDLHNGAVHRHRLELDAYNLLSLQMLEDPVEHAMPAIRGGMMVLDCTCRLRRRCRSNRRPGTTMRKDLRQDATRGPMACEDRRTGGDAR